MEKLESILSDVTSILREEREEQAMRKANMEITKAENIMNHSEEIHSRPKKTWFISEKDKKLLKGQ